MPSMAENPPSGAVTPSAADTRPANLGAGAYLYDLWYLATPDQRLKPGRLVAMTLLGEPLMRPIARRFLGQDRRILALQQEGMAHDPPPMLVDDADRQAKWYYRLKKEWTSSRKENRPFVNPVKERTLRWRT